MSAEETPDLRLHDPPKAKTRRTEFRPYLAPFLLALCDSEGGLTDMELGLKLGGSGADFSKVARKQLVDLGYAEATGGRRKTRGRSTSNVWRATPAGLQKAREMKEVSDGSE